MQTFRFIMCEHLMMYSYVRDVERTICGRDVRKLDIPINARVSVFGHVLYPVLNSTPCVSYVQGGGWGYLWISLLSILVGGGNLGIGITLASVYKTLFLCFSVYLDKRLILYLSSFKTATKDAVSIEIKNPCIVSANLVFVHTMQGF
jgi:hypothetical protein